MLAVENLGISHGPRRLFGGLTFTLRAGQRIALAGPNGAGKSTLMKIISGQERLHEGRVLKAKTITVGYLPQEGVELKGRALMAEAESAFADALDLQGQLREANNALGSCTPGTPEYDEALEVFGDLQIRLEHHDLSKMRPRIERVLAGLGFSRADFERPTGQFSGGWQMRIALAKLLLAEPSVLLLDEPTNHLDIESVVWLEDYLGSYPGAIILVSHDRRLLDNLCDRTLAFEQGRVTLYSGNYSFFERESRARRAQLGRAAAGQQREIARTQRFIDRFRAKATKASQAQSRIKMLEKIERIELEDEDDEIGFSFPQPPPSGHSVVRLRGVAKSYDGIRMVLPPFDLEIVKGDRIAIVGVNGAGKTTFSKILAGVEQPSHGTRKTGHNVRLGYYSQDHADALDGSKTVLQTLEHTARGLPETRLRTLLGCFLFTGDDAFKSVRVLSGGERARLALAQMLLTPANFLVLDEPTNHLDMRSQAVLQRALAQYTGTCVIVSHNRDFLDPLVTRTLEFRVDGPPRLYAGNLGYYLDKKAEERAAAPAPAATSANARATVAEPQNARERRRIEAQRRQERIRVLRPLQDRLATVEAEIARFEEEKRELVQGMSREGFGADPEEVRVTTARYAIIEAGLERAFTAWASASEDVERAEAALAAGESAASPGPESAG